MTTLSHFLRPARHALQMLVCLLLCVVASAAAAQTLSPFQYGLGEASDPTEVYRVLLRTHRAADSCGASVSYAGIDTLRLEIPRDAVSIPLQAENDFGGVVLMVANTKKSLFLFNYTPLAHPIPVSDTAALCRAIDSGDFRGIPPLAEGDWLLHIIDSTPWVDVRDGYQYGHYREDIVTIHDGISQDRPTMPYGAGGSRPTLLGRQLDSTSHRDFLFSNITLVRDSASTASTFLIRLENLPQATLRNIVVLTPSSDVITANDAIVYIFNSTNILIDTVILWDTYSRTDHSGYGLVLGNLRNTHVRHLSSFSKWGIFGTNNMVDTYIEQSDFNRFDIHCYGRNVTIDHCMQQNGYNQFSSLFGTLTLRSCTFDNFTPVLLEDSYKANTHFLLRIDSCRWTPTAEHRTIVQGGSIDGRLNSREELHTPALPDVDISNLEINTTKEIREVELLQLRGRERRAHLHGGLERISLRGVTLLGNPKTKIILSNKRVDLLHEATLETSDGESISLQRIGSRRIN